MSREAAGELRPVMEAAGLAVEAEPSIRRARRSFSLLLFARAAVWLAGEYARIGARAVTTGGRTPSSTIVALPAARVRPRRLYFASKRTIDLMVATLALILLLPLMLLIGLAVAIDSSGPVLFVQERTGKKGRLFRIYKFRSMVVSAPKYSMKVARSDPRVTRVGRFLRASGLDELPQLVNVLRGEMTLVGPRPEQPFIVEEYEPWQRSRLDVTPGITGWWQIHHREDVPMQEGISYDLDYIAAMGPAMDIGIALRTVKVMASGAWRALRGRPAAS